MKILTLALAGTLLAGATYAQETAAPLSAAPDAPSVVASTNPGTPEKAMEAAAPAVFSSIDDLTYAGEILGNQAWISAKDNMLWMQDPRTGVITVGFVFDKDGMAMHPNLRDAGVTVASFVDQIQAQKTPSISVPKQYEADVSKVLSQLDEEKRKIALKRLADVSAGVTDEAAYQKVMAGWIAEVNEALIAQKSGTAAPADLQKATSAVKAPVPEGVDPAVEKGAISVEKAEPHADLQKAVSPVKAPVPETSAAGEKKGAIEIDKVATTDSAPAAAEPEFIDAVSGAYGLDVGPEGKPVINLVLEPTCEACKYVVRDLMPKAMAGDIRLHVALVAAGNADSFGVISGILTSEDPARTLLDASAEKDAAKPFARVSDLSEKVQTEIRMNGEMVIKYGIPSAPFIAIMTEKGPVYIKGVPSAEQLAGALPYGGKKPVEAPADATK